MEILKKYLVLTKGGIVIFVLVGGIAGYAQGLPTLSDFSLSSFLLLLFGMYAISSGSFAINQAQEAHIDAKMERTKTRPAASGWISKADTYWLGLFLVTAGAAALWVVEPVAGILGLMTVALYNGFYTMIWKRKWAFAAVPGAIPGAMPVVIGYAGADSNIFTAECLYLFLVMFLWQMPHFWAIAIKLKNDYEKGGIPVLPVVIGEQKTVFHLGLYTFVYAGLALASPAFVETKYVYLITVFPAALMLLFELFKYANDVFERNSQQRWLRFFMWVNVTLLIFLVAPVADKWLVYF